jgi:hypothetical protein
MRMSYLNLCFEFARFVERQTVKSSGKGIYYINMCEQIFKNIFAVFQQVYFFHLFFAMRDS